MAFTYRGSASAPANSGTEVDCNRPAGVQVGDVIIAVYAFENVAAGSAPWIVPNIGQFSTNYIGPSQQWLQICQQGPSANGVGIEVWAAIHGSGTVQDAMLNGTYNAVTVTVAYGGEYNPSGVISAGVPVRGSTTAQVTGNAPSAPSVFAFANDLVVACAGDTMTGAGYGTPAGYTNRIDVNRAGAGTAEATIADAVALTSGNTGLITFPNNASSSSAKGSTATLDIRPTASPAGSGSPLLEFSYPIS